MRKLLAFAFVLAFVASCGNENKSATSTTTETAPVAQSSLSPEQLGQLGAKIQKNPDNAKNILSDAGMTEESFEQAVRKVSEDPAAAKRYSEAFRKAAS